jgi:hypothetical protein
LFRCAAAAFPAAVPAAGLPAASRVRAITGWEGETSISRNRNAARSRLERESGRNLRGASGDKSGGIMRSFTVTPKRPKSRLQFRHFQAIYRETIKRREPQTLQIAQKTIVLVANPSTSLLL